MIKILIETHTHVYFENPKDRTHALIEGGFLGRELPLDRMSKWPTKT